MLVAYLLLAIIAVAVVIVVAVALGPALAEPIDSPSAALLRDQRRRIAENHAAVDEKRFNDIRFSTSIRGYDLAETDRYVENPDTLTKDVSIPLMRDGYTMAEVDAFIADVVGDVTGHGIADSKDPAGAETAGNDQVDVPSTEVADDGALGDDNLVDTRVDS